MAKERKQEAPPETRPNIVREPAAGTEPEFVTLTKGAACGPSEMPEPGSDQATLALRLELFKTNFYASQRLDRHLTQKQARGLRYVQDGYQKKQAALENGQVVQSHFHAVQKLLEEIADAGDALFATSAARP